MSWDIDSCSYCLGTRMRNDLECMVCNGSGRTGDEKDVISIKLESHHASLETGEAHIIFHMNIGDTVKHMEAWCEIESDKFIHEYMFYRNTDMKILEIGKDGYYKVGDEIAKMIPSTSKGGKKK